MKTHKISRASRDPHAGPSQRRRGERRKPEAAPTQLIELLEGAQTSATMAPSGDQVSTSEKVDHTRERIRALIHSFRPIRGIADLAMSDEYQCGRTLLEVLADSADGTNDPTRRLSAEECAQVLDYLSSVEPFDGRTWWEEPEGEPSRHCGLVAILDTLAASLRQPAVAPNDDAAAASADAAAEESGNPLTSVEQRIDQLIYDVADVQSAIACVILAMDGSADFQLSWTNPVHSALRIAESRLEALTDDGNNIHGDLAKLIRAQPITDPTKTVNAAIAATEALYQDAKAGSNDEREYEEAITHLKEALVHIKFVA